MTSYIYMDYSLLVFSYNFISF